jgi:2-polyprenyl-3-methyl-5-hydroxy-6-metoxy-1,4-benzoquinol methylase
MCAKPGAKPFWSERHNGQAYNVVYCRHCELYQTAEQFDSISPEYMDLSLTDINESRLWCQADHKRAAFDQCFEVHQRLTDKPVSTIRLLDVGCATGGFLSYARTIGVRHLYGFDASAAQIQHSREHFETVRVATNVAEYLSQLAISLQFDFITMWDVLEHVREPRNMLSGLTQALSSDGLLFASVPNGGALKWKKTLATLPNTPYALVPWEHVFYHSTASLARLMSSVDCSLVWCGTAACYPRPLTAFELLRRIGFRMLSRIPSLSPQICVFARKTPCE